MKIVIDSAIPFITLSSDESREIVFYDGDKFTKDLVKDADALIIRTRTKCNSSLLKDSKVKFIATATIGTDHIDMEWCRENGIKVANAPGCNAPGVAQYVFSSLFSQGFNPETDTLGIIGYGNVGSLVGKWAKDMGITILVCDPPRKEIGFTDIEYVSLEELLERSKAVTIHVPLTGTGPHPTKNMIDRDQLEMMPHGSILINSSRGNVVVEKALKEKLSNHSLRAVIDVWENEPNIDNDLLKLSSIATPHIAGYSLEGKMRATYMALEAFEKFFNVKTGKDTLIPALTPPDRKITRQLVTDSYDPMIDSEALRKEPNKFEELRNKYNYRHEPLFSEIS